MPTSQSGIVVVYESGVDAYTEALEGIGAGLDGHRVRAIDLKTAPACGELAHLLGSGEARLAIAVGSRALAEVQARKAGVPLVATMVLQGAATEGVAGTVELDVPLAAQLDVIRTLLPRCSRVGIVRNPARSRYTAEALEARVRKQGFTPSIVNCEGAAHLLKAVASVKGTVDLLLCFPDPDLYNSVTIKPLILASLEDRLPVIGFSPAFVRAGAAAGIYPDYREMGRQTAALALRLLRGEDRAVVEEPAKLHISVNQRVARLLGVEFQTAGQPVEVMR
jgi:putative ABC transport system substrate-binding protein